MAMLTDDWLEAVQGEFHKPYYKELYQFVKEEYSKVVVYPPSDDIFNAMHSVSHEKHNIVVFQHSCPSWRHQLSTPHNGRNYHGVRKL